jgi:hypothetical protein
LDVVQNGNGVFVVALNTGSQLVEREAVKKKLGFNAKFS